MANGWGGARPNSGPKRVAANGAPKKRPEPTHKPAAEPKPRWMPTFEQVKELVALSQQHSRNQPRTADNSPFKIPEHPRQATPPNGAMAMDSGIVENNSWATNAWVAGSIFDGLAGEGIGFLGYPFLSQLAQRPEYRVISETIADDATRKWIDFEVTGEEEENRRRSERDPVGEAERMDDPDERKKRVAAAGKTDKVKALKDDQDRLGVRDHFYSLCRDDGFFGRTHLFMQFGDDDLFGNPDELKAPIGHGNDALSKSKIAQGSFKRLKTIEPLWCYPMLYNAVNPLLPDWYDPQQWYVMGREVHKSRLLPFVGHPVPDLLKPAYSFGGLSMSQMAKPYVDIWLVTRQSVADIVRSFSVMVLMTDLSTLITPGGAGDLMARVAMFNYLRDSQGTIVVNKATEDFKNIAAPLSGLDHLQAQALEHLASVSRIPLVKLTGISPSGLNATSEQEINVYDDTIMAYQNRFVRPGLTRVVDFEQLSLWGEVHPEITFVFEKLRETTAKEKAELQKMNAERHQVYVDMGAVGNDEVRNIAINDPELEYTGLDPDDMPDLREEEGAGLIPPGSGKGIEAVLGEGEQETDQ